MAQNISKAQKWQKDFQESIYSTRKSKKKNEWTEWRAGARYREPLAR